MTGIDVRFDSVSKRYRLGRSGRAAPGESSEFWAVRDISFDVLRGETLGLIGDNGAGKSTILKLLSRITAPTSGTITLNGRLAALIEVGSGFHPELTGRENVFLSGAILGMRRREIIEKLDRIIDFAGVGRFIDVPVKRYSSGMFVRLGFAIAAHLEADILLVDEVLAVGDAAYQLRCYERIDELRRAGTTMIFVSHDLGSVERLCDRVALVSGGQLVSCGDARRVIDAYQQQVAHGAVRDVAGISAAPSAGGVTITSVQFSDEDGRELVAASTGSRLRARVALTVKTPVPDAVVEIFYYSRDGRTLHCQQSTALSGEPLALAAGDQSIEFTCDELGLQPGIYAIGAAVRERRGSGTLEWWYGSRVLHVAPGKSVRGYFYAPHEWRWVRASQADRRPADV